MKAPQSHPHIALARARRMKQRGRGALIWVLVFVAVSQVGLTAVLHYWRPDTVARVIYHKRQRLEQLARQTPDHSLVVMLGSSRTEGAFDASRSNGRPGPDGKPLVAYNY